LTIYRAARPDQQTDFVDAMRRAQVLQLATRRRKGADSAPSASNRPLEELSLQRREFAFPTPARSGFVRPGGPIPAPQLHAEQPKAAHQG
jgi:hypothetical protein